MSSPIFQFSDWFGHSAPFVPPQTCLPLCLNSELPTQQEKQVEATAVVLKWSRTVVVLQEGHVQGVFSSMKGLDDFYSWGYRCCHMEHL